jgi:hypothetical protein
MGDVEDPDIYAAGPLYEFMQSDKGKWCKGNSKDMYYLYRPHDFGYKFSVWADFTKRQLTEYYLRY